MTNKFLQKMLTFVLTAALALGGSLPALALEGEAQVYVDSGAARSVDDDWGWLGSHIANNTMTYNCDAEWAYTEFTLKTAQKITSFTYATGNVFRTEIMSESQDTSSERWETVIRQYEDSPEGNFFDETPGTVYTDTLTVTMADNSTKTFPCKLTIDDEATFGFYSGDTEYWWNINVGETLTIKMKPTDKNNTLVGKNLSYTWTVVEGDAYLQLVSSNGDTCVIRGIALGDYILNVDITSDGEHLLGRNIHKRVGGEYVPTDDLVNGAGAELAKGENASMDIPASGGITAGSFQKLKEEGKSHPSATVSMTNAGDNSLSYSFKPSEVDPNWSGTFSPSFTNKVPGSAASQGYSTINGVWLDFYYSGTLPAPMTITKKVSASDFPAGSTTFKVWYFDTAIGKLTEQSMPVVYDATAGTITFKLTRFSTYAVYPDGVDPNAGVTPPSTGGDSGGSGSSSGSSKSLLGAGSGKAALKPAGAAQVNQLTEAALAMAKASGSKKATVSLTNRSSISAAILKQLAANASKAGISVQLTSDIKKGNVVESRLYIDPTKATLAQGLKLGVVLGDKKLEEKLAKSFRNPMQVIALEQEGNFGMPIAVAARVNLKGLNVKTLQAYSYDAKTNKLTAVEGAACWVDSNGYLHFDVSAGGVIVVTDRPLTSK